MSVISEIKIREKMMKAFNELVEKVKKIQGECKTKEDLVTWTLNWNSCMAAMHVQFYGDVAERQIKTYITLIEKMRAKKPELVNHLTKGTKVAELIDDEFVELQSSKEVKK